MDDVINIQTALGKKKGLPTPGRGQVVLSGVYILFVCLFLEITFIQFHVPISQEKPQNKRLLLMNLNVH